MAHGCRPDWVPEWGAGASRGQASSLLGTPVIRCEATCGFDEPEHDGSSEGDAARHVDWRRTVDLKNQAQRRGGHNEHSQIHGICVNPDDRCAPCQEHQHATNGISAEEPDRRREEQVRENRCQRKRNSRRKGHRLHGGVLRPGFEQLLVRVVHDHRSTRQAVSSTIEGLGIIWEQLRVAWVGMFPLRLLGNQVISDKVQPDLRWDVDGHVATICTLIAAAQGDEALKQPIGCVPVLDGRVKNHPNGSIPRLLHYALESRELLGWIVGCVDGVFPRH